MRTKFLFATIVTCLFSVLISCSNSNSPTNVAVEAVTLLTQKKAAEAANYIYFGNSLSSSQIASSQAMFIALAEDKVYPMIDKQGGVKSIEAVKTDIDPENKDRANVSLKIIYNNGKEEDSNVEFIKIDDKWYWQLKK